MAKSPFLTFLDAFESECSPDKGRDSGPLLIFGENALLSQEFVTAYRRQWLSLNPDSETQIVDVDKSSLASFTQQLAQIDLFSPSTLYVVSIKDHESVLDGLSKSLNKLAASQKIVIIFSAKKLSDKVRKNFDALRTTTLHAANPAPFETGHYVMFRAKQSGLTLNQDAAALLVECCGQDLNHIRNEVERLSLIFSGEKAAPKLSAALIREHLGFLKEDEIFKLRQLLLEGRRALALSLITDLLRRGESALAILGILSKHIRQSCLILRGLQQSRPPQELISLSGLHPATLKRYTEYCRKIGLPRLRAAWKQCVKADQRLKSNAMGDELVLTEIVQLMI